MSDYRVPHTPLSRQIMSEGKDMLDDIRRAIYPHLEQDWREAWMQYLAESQGLGTQQPWEGENDPF